MAQLFTVCFPKYCFSIQDTFTLTFHANKLPFEYTVSPNGVAHVSNVHIQNEEKDNHHHHHEKLDDRLTAGLTITHINDESITNEIRDSAGSFACVISNDKILTKPDLDSIIKKKQDSEITITFKEDIIAATADETEALGLGIEHKYIEDKYIEDKAIRASSYNATYPPSNARLNHVEKYWSPTEEDEKSRDVWICIDLHDICTVDRIHIQGSQNHDQYVRELWIEYSDDLCSWKSHPMGIIKCEYFGGAQHDTIDEEKDIPIAGNLEEITSVHDDIFDKNMTHYAMAIIKLWPVINARFIRIRPWEWKNHIAMRLELFGHRELLENRHILRLVNEKDVDPSFKQQMKDSINYHRQKYPMDKHEPGQSDVIQSDCKALVTEAMERTRCTSYAIMEADHNKYLLVFTTKGSEISELVMDELKNIGIGEDMGVISATSIVWRDVADYIDESPLKKEGEANKSMWALSVKSHQAVQIVNKKVLDNADFNFDYFCMLMVASLIAVGGLATNSAVIVVASMLVSPIMGPVLAFTFGVTTSNRHMAKMGFLNEIFSLFICVLVGFVVGFFWALCTNNRNDWPTEEMAARGQLYALADGAYIAFVSGIGVALALVGEYLTTVVGVAISASLLPPAVNCGMLLSFTIYDEIYPEYVYHNYDVDSVVKMGFISLVLTIENIIIIFLSATIMFKVKEIKTTGHQHHSLWRHITHVKTTARTMKRQGVHISQADLLQDDDDDYDHQSIDEIYRKPGSNAHKASKHLSRVKKHSVRQSGTLKRTLLKREYTRYNTMARGGINNQRTITTLSPLAPIEENMETMEITSKNKPKKKGLYRGVASSDCDNSGNDEEFKEEEQNIQQIKNN